LVALKECGCPVTVAEIINHFEKRRLLLGLPELKHALATLQARGTLKEASLDGQEYWSLSDAKLTPSVKDHDVKATSRGVKDKVTRSLLDLIELASKHDDERSVAVLEHAITQLYSSEKIY
jgi:hypothetical protein